jgi:hypothetical protein
MPPTSAQSYPDSVPLQGTPHLTYTSFDNKLTEIIDAVNTAAAAAHVTICTTKSSQANSPVLVLDHARAKFLDTELLVKSFSIKSIKNVLLM